MRIAIALGVVLLATPAWGQAPQRPRLPLTGNIIQDFGPKTGLTGAPVTDLQNFFNAKLLPDLQYALLLAKATGNNITAQCYQAWIDVITVQQTAVQTGTPPTDIPIPDPHIITDFERAVELRNMIQPDSKFMTACSPVANLIKQDVLSFMGKVVGGGAGLLTMIPGL